MVRVWGLALVLGSALAWVQGWDQQWGRGWVLV